MKRSQVRPDFGYELRKVFRDPPACASRSEAIGLRKNLELKT